MELSLKWFKDQLKKSVDRVVEKRVDTAAEELAIEEIQGQIAKEEDDEDDLWDDYEDDWEDEEKDLIEEPLYLSIKLINNTLTVVLNDGSILSKPDATSEDFYDVKDAQTVDQIMEVMSAPEFVEEQKKAAAEYAKDVNLYKGISIIKSSPDFEVGDSCIYLKGVKRSVPQLLVEKFAELLGAGQTEEYEAVKKFWLKCCLNPNAQSAEDLYAFLKHHQFKIDKHGNFYAYRRVVSKGSDNQKLVEFISSAYTKIKAVWKKKPSDYVVLDRKETGYVFSKIGTEVEGVVIGNLESLYLDLPNMQKMSYTSAHTGLEDYRIGEVMSMPRQNGDDNNTTSCSKGFHAASKAYDYSGFGNTPILMIINPMDVLAVPRGEWGKLRTCRWFFATTLDENEKYILDDDAYDVSELGDVFEAKCASNLQEHIENSFAEEVKRHTFNLSPISPEEIKKIVVSLDDMRKSISSRVKEVSL